MEKGSFIGYHYTDDVHDAVVKRVHQENERLQVDIETIEGHAVAFSFTGVQTVDAHQAEGMLLYSLSEMESPPPYRRFVFTNSDDDDPARLEIVARGVHRE
ncbi:MAG TPA: hypothetical protein VFX97_16480 [Pyrinomonadaceae bacterium]|nr:hypothetical protein [Pyrinomonadaceae bacterium]